MQATLHISSCPEGIKIELEKKFSARADRHFIALFGRGNLQTRSLLSLVREYDEVLVDKLEMALEIADAEMIDRVGKWFDKNALSRYQQDLLAYAAAVELTVVER